MSNDYPFSPYPDPFSPLAPTPTQPTPQPVTWPAQPTPPAQEPAYVHEPFPSATPISEANTSTSESFSEPPATFVDEDDEDNAVQKTALAIVAGVLVLFILIGFGIWYFLRDTGENEELPALPRAEEQDTNFILAAAGGKIITPEGATLIIPVGALVEDTKLEISKVRDGDVTDLFELKPLGQKFLKPVTVEIPYKKSGPIILEYWKEEGGEKLELRYTVDREEKKLSTLLEEF